MKKCLLGKTNIEVSRMGLGTVKFGRTQGVKYPAPFTLPNDAEVANLLAVASELGINLLDTAPAYGTSEERLGHVLRGQRKDWVICTKVGETFIDGESQFDFSSSAIMLSVERSLKRLRTDYLDIVLVHSNGDDQRIIEEDAVFITLDALKKAGKVRAFGMSTKTVSGGLLAVNLADVVMVTLNPAATSDWDVILEAHQKQKGIFIKKALASGHLQSTVADNMRFIFREPGVTSVIVGTINPVHLRENAAAVGFIDAMIV